VRAASGISDWTFLWRFLTRPLAVASPIPSSPRLAKRIAQEIDNAQNGFVLELGPGTGAVTRALLAHGVAANDLIAIESDPTFVRLLSKALSAVTVLQGDAFDFRAVLRMRGLDKPLRAIVCGVPVLSKSLEIRQAFLRNCIKALQPGGPFIQFTYDVRPPIPPTPEADVTHAAALWWNFPPMHVWTYRSAS
jgi:phosphatidylethanolamine/phosphatidyl-N-methylethanolamine N-methyltransferase